MFSFNQINIPNLQEKPRSKSITSILDSGIGLQQVKDIIEISGEWIDVVKFGWGTSRLVPRSVLQQKIELYKSASVEVCTGGTLMEIALAQNKVNFMLQEAKQLGFTRIEISNGVHPMNAEQKINLIKQAIDAGFTVWSEVGKKSPEEDARLSLFDRLEAIQKELEAGSQKVILEARESGTVGIYDKSGKPIEEIIQRIVEEIGLEKLVFEAPKKSQQLWMIQNFGIHVNLANVAVKDIIALTTLRSGLRGDTFPDIHLAGIDLFLELGVGGGIKARQRGGIVILIDALRASATIITALAIGMKAVIPVASVEQCKGDVTAGERGGKKIPSLDHSNSPYELQNNDYKDKTLALTTTNGTECILAAHGDSTTILIGTTLNCQAVAKAAIELAEKDQVSITILMAGRNNQECIEDSLSASEIIRSMGSKVRVRGAMPPSSQAIEADFFAGASGQNLVKLGYTEDVRYCAQLNKFDTVPIYQNNRLVKYE